MTANPTITWIRQHRYLWTGRAAGMPAGTIEHGARYHYVDVEGVKHPGFHTLEAAQRATEALLT